MNKAIMKAFADELEKCGFAGEEGGKARAAAKGALAGAKLMLPTSIGTGAGLMAGRLLGKGRTLPTILGGALGGGAGAAISLRNIKGSARKQLGQLQRKKNLTSQDRKNLAVLRQFRKGGEI